MLKDCEEILNPKKLRNPQFGLHYNVVQVEHLTSLDPLKIEQPVNECVRFFKYSVYLC